MPAHHLTVGATVYDAAGATVGTLDRYEPQGSYLTPPTIVQKRR